MWTPDADVSVTAAAFLCCRTWKLREKKSEQMWLVLCWNLDCGIEQGIREVMGFWHGLSHGKVYIDSLLLGAKHTEAKLGLVDPVPVHPDWA